MVYQTAPFSMTLNNPVFKVTLYFDDEYLINGKRYGHRPTMEGEYETPPSFRTVPI